MPTGLARFQHSGDSHFVTFSCDHREPKFVSAAVYDLFPLCLEDMRCKYEMRIYGYVVMPEHVHLLVSEPEHETLADAVHYLKSSFTKRLHGRRFRAQVIAQQMGANLGHRLEHRLEGYRGEVLTRGPFWEQRYHDRNVRDMHEFSVKLRYLHRNPVKRGLVKEPAEWKWSSFRHYAFREIGVVQIESEWTARERELKQSGGQARIFLCPR